jgi:hypothetical protein
MSECNTTPATLDSRDYAAAHRRQCWLEWFGRAVIVAALSVAVVGGFGPGLISRRTIAAADGRFRIEYQLTERFESPAVMRIYLPRASSGRTRLALGRAFTNNIVFEQIMPKPSGVEAAGNRVLYAFDVAPGEQELEVVIRFKFDEFGWRKFEVGPEAEPPLTVHMFVWP